MLLYKKIHWLKHKFKFNLQAEMNTRPVKKSFKLWFPQQTVDGECDLGDCPAGHQQHPPRLHLLQQAQEQVQSLSPSPDKIFRLDWSEKMKIMGSFLEAYFFQN